MRSFGHITARYVFCRLLDTCYRKQHADHPWLTPQAIRILIDWVRCTDRGIEWGSGKSTAWFAQRIEHLVSIEHDLIWYERTLTWLVRNGLSSRVEQRLLPLRREVERKDSGEVVTHQPYVTVVNEYCDESFDFALVDGRLRHLCTAMVLPKIRPGGLLILDNSERYIPSEGMNWHSTNAIARQEWQSVLVTLNRWRTIETTNGVWRTRFWIKPC